jgi:hypothetical protein
LAAIITPSGTIRLAYEYRRALPDNSTSINTIGWGTFTTAPFTLTHASQLEVTAEDDITWWGASQPAWSPDGTRLAYFALKYYEPVTPRIIIEDHVRTVNPDSGAISGDLTTSSIAPVNRAIFTRLDWSRLPELPQPTPTPVPTECEFMIDTLGNPGPNLNVRTFPNQTSFVIVSIPDNGMVTVTGRYQGGVYFHVRVLDQATNQTYEGWVIQDALVLTYTENGDILPLPCLETLNTVDSYGNIIPTPSGSPIITPTPPGPTPTVLPTAPSPLSVNVEFISTSTSNRYIPYASELTYRITLTNISSVTIQRATDIGNLAPNSDSYVQFSAPVNGAGEPLSTAYQFIETSGGFMMYPIVKTAK